MNDAGEAQNISSECLQSASVPNLANKEVLNLSDARSTLAYQGAGGNEEPTNIQLDVRKSLAEHRSALISRGIHRRGCTAMNRGYRPVVSELDACAWMEPAKR
jgi:hypothetical protein